MTTRSLAGRCFCGAVGYIVRDAFEYALYCHCSQCRRTTGSAFKPLAGVPMGALSIRHGAEAIQRVGDDRGADIRCGSCGSLLYSIVRDGAYVHVAMGTLDDAPTIRPTAHIFVGSKAPWFEIADGLPQFAEFPPA